MLRNKDQQRNSKDNGHNVTIGYWISSSVNNVVQSAITGTVAGVAIYFVSNNILGYSAEAAKRNAFALGNGIGGVTLATKTVASTWTVMTEPMPQ